MRRITRRIRLQGLTAGLLAWTLAQPAAAATFTKGPYLQALGTEAVTIKAELSASERVRVEIDADGDAALRRVVTSDAAVLQLVRVSGLSPATAYAYRVVAGAGESAAGRFTTPPADARPFRFLLYGDNRSDAAAHAAVVRAMEAAPSDFLLHTGDMVAEGDRQAQWQTFFEIEGKLLRDRCVFAAVGNHELTEGTGASFLKYFGTPREAASPGLYGSFRWSNTRFFLLNAMDEWTGEERTWLRAELERSTTEPGVVHRFAVLHHGPYSSGPHGANPRLPAGDIVAMLTGHGVDLLFAGHDHIYERGEGKGLKYVISGGGGAPLYPRKTQAPETLMFESVHHFVEVAVDGDRVDIVARRASGGVIERCGFQGAGSWECEAKPAAPPPGPASAGDASRPSGARSCACAVAGAPEPGPSGWLAVVVAVLGTRRRGQARRSAPVLRA